MYIIEHGSHIYSTTITQVHEIYVTNYYIHASHFFNYCPEAIDLNTKNMFSIKLKCYLIRQTASLATCTQATPINPCLLTGSTANTLELTSSHRCARYPAREHRREYHSHQIRCQHCVVVCVCLCRGVCVFVFGGEGRGVGSKPCCYLKLCK